MNVILLAALAAFCLVGIVLAALQLPGTWLIAAAAVGYDWCHDWHQFGWKWLVAMGLLAGAAEFVDFLSALLATHKAGASRRASVGAIAGGLLGMFALSLPLPLIGTIAGGLVGCFLGAFVGELSGGNRAEGDGGHRLATGTRVGLYAALGRLLGLLVKTAVAMILAGLAIRLALQK